MRVLWSRCYCMQKSQIPTASLLSSLCNAVLCVLSLVLWFPWLQARGLHGHIQIVKQLHLCADLCLMNGFVDYWIYCHVAGHNVLFGGSYIPLPGTDYQPYLSFEGKKSSSTCSYSDSPWTPCYHMWFREVLYVLFIHFQTHKKIRES